MNLERIVSPKSRAFNLAWKIYVNSFPDHERRGRANQISLLKNKNYRFCAVIVNKGVAGLMGDWKLKGFYFIEHLGIREDLRNKGIGSKILREYGQRHKRVIFEVERPEVGEMVRRKIETFKGIGYVLNEHDYIQPAYGLSKRSWPLLLMSFKKPITLEEYPLILGEIHTKVYGSNASITNLEGNLNIRGGNI